MTMSPENVKRVREAAALAGDELKEFLTDVYLAYVPSRGV